MAREGFGTDPTGRLAAGAPRGGGGFGGFGVGVGGGATVGPGWKSGPMITLKKSFAKGGKVGSASKRADGIARKGKTKGRMV